ncbi:MAG: hypothetical protein NZ846_00405 [Thermus sp.]|uniref:hypothetical protein n=1 Tax=Thermus sp. TaxID=275 RepID=UPI0025D0217E|nr:hypothetical protein [Thermus sp.]MCS6869624.1 hypothetical protein [Thermus sp.]MCS7217438.1 hypothetical protein [Thermus sp.]MCX7848783.1 hypothetical protein [Thermus sp.]MDW8016675.1 hypothetical protein [Thermus sp.]MDW8358143.1 hypothetical protein [Thermus sp.]
MRRYLMALALALAACAPQVTQSPEARPQLKEVGFYPSTTGLEWVYVPEGEALSAPPYRVRAEGPAVFEGQEALRFRSFGRGEERVYYRQVGPFGVRLLGFQDPSARVVFTPALLEYPPEALLSPGYRWGGTVQVRVELLTPGGREPLAQGALDYTMEVLEEREVRLPAGVFRVYRIRQTFRDRQGQDAREVWLAPRVGEVRTREGRILVERNFN